MLYGFFNRVSTADQLKQGLDVGSQRMRLVADRVSKATLQAPDGFALPEPGAEPSNIVEGPVDLEAEMVALADEQIRFQATSRLLQKTYQQIRASIRER